MTKNTSEAQQNSIPTCKTVFLHYGWHVGIEFCKATAELFVIDLLIGLIRVSNVERQAIKNDSRLCKNGGKHHRTEKRKVLRRLDLNERLAWFAGRSWSLRSTWESWTIAAGRLILWLATFGDVFRPFSPTLDSFNENRCKAT